MTDQEFDVVLTARMQKIQNTLSKKAGEYASTIDRLHNFKLAANLESNPQTPEQALWGMLKKHLVSVIDIIDATKLGNCPTDEIRDEKLGDSINYLILLEALLIERRHEAPKILHVQV